MIEMGCVVCKLWCFWRTVWWLEVSYWGSVIIHYLKAWGKQFKLQFDDFVVLTDILMQSNNGLLLHGAKKNFYKYLGKLIERTASTVHLSEKFSVGRHWWIYLRTWINWETFWQRLVRPEVCSWFALAQDQNKTNCKQLSLFQYCMGAWGEWKRQLWCILSRMVNLGFWPSLASLG